MGLALPDLRATSGTAVVEAMRRLCGPPASYYQGVVEIVLRSQRRTNGRLYTGFFLAIPKKAAFVSSGGYDSFLEWDPCAHRVV
jgi:hypothetical protein